MLYKWDKLKDINELKYLNTNIIIIFLLCSMGVCYYLILKHQKNGIY